MEFSSITTTLSPEKVRIHHNTTTRVKDPTLGRRFIFQCENWLSLKVANFGGSVLSLDP